MPSSLLPVAPRSRPDASPSSHAVALQVASQARRRLPWLWWGGWITLALALPLLLLGQLDERTLQGVNVWTKPLKFHLSAGLHLLTLAWCGALLRDTPARARGFAALSAVALASTLFELGYIAWRASRGEASHFNVGDAFAGTMYTLMGLLAVLLVGCAGVLGWWILRARDFDHGPVLQRGLALGLLAGWLMGTLAGGYLGAQSGHGVAVPPGDLQALPLMGWLRGGGDLRVAHFFGLHAMHVIPLVAWLASRRLAPAAALRSVHGFTAAYAGFTVFTFAQAVMGRPFF